MVFGNRWFKIKLLGCYLLVGVRTLELSFKIKEEMFNYVSWLSVYRKLGVLV